MARISTHAGGASHLTPLARLARRLSLVTIVALGGCGGGGGDDLLVTTPPPSAPPPSAPPEYTAEGDVLVSGDGTYEMHNVRTKGSLTKDGTSLLTLYEYNRFDAGTFINAGTVHAVGDLRSNVTIQPGAELVGYVALIGNIQNAGTLSVAICSPWDYGCTLQINGNYTQAADGKLRVQLGSGMPWQVVVDGTATLSGGTLEFFVDPGGGYIGTAPYREGILVTEAGLTGTFDRWTSPGLFLEGNLVYSPGSVVFDVTRVPVASAMQAQGVGDPVLLGTAARIDGAFNAADPLARTPRASLPLAQQQFFDSAASLQRIRDAGQAIHMLDSLSGEAHVLGNGLLLDEAGPSSSMRARLDALQRGGQPGAWAGADRQDGGLRGAFAEGGHYSGVGLMAGHDLRVGRQWSAGTAVGQSLGYLQFDRGGGWAQIQSTPLELAFTRHAGPVYTQFSAGYRSSRLTVDRPLDVADGESHWAHSRRQAHTTHLRAEVGRNGWARDARWMPFAALGHDRVRSDAFVEQGNTGFELAVLPGTQWRTYADVGVRYLRQGQWRQGGWWQLDVSGHRRTVLDASPGTLQAAFTGMPAATFLLGDDAIGRDQSVMTLRWAGSGGAHWWWYAQYRDVSGGPLPSRGGELGLVVPF